MGRLAEPPQKWSELGIFDKYVMIIMGVMAVAVVVWMIVGAFMLLEEPHTFEVCSETPTS